MELESAVNAESVHITPLAANKTIDHLACHPLSILPAPTWANMRKAFLCLPKRKVHYEKVKARNVLDFIFDPHQDHRSLSMAPAVHRSLSTLSFSPTLSHDIDTLGKKSHSYLKEKMGKSFRQTSIGSNSGGKVAH